MCLFLPVKLAGSEYLLVFGVSPWLTSGLPFPVLAFLPCRNFTDPPLLIETMGEFGALKVCPTGELWKSASLDIRGDIGTTGDIGVDGEVEAPGNVLRTVAGEHSTDLLILVRLSRGELLMEEPFDRGDS